MISKGKLAQIHIAKQQLGLSDDDYRAILARTAGVSSSKDLTDRNVGAVLHEFKRLGWQPKAPKRAGRVPNTLNKREQMAKIEALLSEMGLSWEYAQAIARRQTGIERIDWLKTEAQFRGVIAALDVEHEKRCGLSAVDEEIARLGLTRDQVAERYGLSPGWQRNRKSLAALVEYLRSIKRPD
jgi:phage gp16-like protein